MTRQKEVGPIYGVSLLESLPLDGGTMLQALPSRADLAGVQNYRQGQRVVAGYEVLLEHYRRLKEIVDKLPKTADGVPVYKGMPFWVIDADSGEIESGVILYWFELASWDWDGIYSTREAAEKAKEEA